MSIPAILVTGTAKYSLGESFVSQYCCHFDHLPIITLDRQLNTGLARFEKVNAVQINLNPFDYSGGYSSFEIELNTALQNAVNQLSCSAIDTAVLSAALYASGPFIKQTLETRKDLLGVNVCGKYEVLHSVLSLNKKHGFDNRRGLTLIDIGSRHGLCPSHGRSLYATSKAIGLDLCVALQNGKELRRCIHLAPGPIDTYMLHKNYWVSKEKGPASFLNYLLSHHEELYREIFIECHENALKEACTVQSIDIKTIMDKFTRYKNRRRLKLQTAEGILKAKDVADLLVDIVTDDEGNPPGVYVVTAPEGKMQIERLSFSQFRSRI
jgi:short-subunit dehydrogenase